MLSTLSLEGSYITHETQTLKFVYVIHLYSIMSHGTHFWTKETDSRNTFSAQKKIIRMADVTEEILVGI
jgi:predicted RNase H-related nuclease YkuK (DUF458 family)